MKYRQKQIKIENYLNYIITYNPNNEYKQHNKEYIENIKHPNKSSPSNMQQKQRLYQLNQTMTISRNRKHFQIIFDTCSEVNNNQNNPDHEEEKDVIQKFIYPYPGFHFNVTYSQQVLKEVQREADKMKQRVTCFTNQYGAHNQKTSSIFLNLLQVTREIGTNQLKKKQYINACYFYQYCLRFIEPEDEVYLEKFIIIKIDIINQLMFCLFQIKCCWKNDGRYLDWGENVLQGFIKKIKQYAFQENIRKNNICRIYKKKKNYLKAIESFGKSQQIISQKIKLKIYQKKEELLTFAKNIEIKTFYKISKCLRYTQPQSVRLYQVRALTEAQQYNPALYQYINKKIRMYYSGREFINMLNKMENKKRIQEDVLKLIQSTNQKQICSLYDVYKDNPNKIHSSNEKYKNNNANHHHQINNNGSCDCGLKSCSKGTGNGKRI